MEDEESDDGEDVEKLNAVTKIDEIKFQKAKEVELSNKTNVGVNRSRKQSRKPTVSAKALLQAQNQSKKSFLLEALMSSIFAWNMRGFNKPRKHNAVKHWVQAGRLSLGYLLETRVQATNFPWIFQSTFPGWSSLTNYDHHRLGRIWVVWSDAVEVVPVLITAQMITCWVRFRHT